MTITATAPTLPELGLEPVRVMRRRWPKVLSATLTAAMVVALLHELLDAGLAGLDRTAPDNPAFYLVFLLLYLLPPLADFLIFRRLWRIPAAGFAALARKRIANEVLFGYSGEALFYAWARARGRMVAAPFGAVKDVTILSAMVGHAVTLALVALVLPYGWSLLTPALRETMAWAAAATALMSVPILLFRKRVFSLDRGTLLWVFGMHCARLLAVSLLLALAWHLALPHASPFLWLFLATTRLLVSRLPLVPNKDLLFAGVAMVAIGPDQPLTELVAFSAALTLLLHVALVAAFGAATLARRAR